MELIEKEKVKEALKKLRWSVETDDPSLEPGLDMEDFGVQDEILEAIDAIPAVKIDKKILEKAEAWELLYAEETEKGKSSVMTLHMKDLLVKARRSLELEKEEEGK